MKATDFEYRHQTLVHQLIVGAAFLTYLIDREDVVWRFVKDSATPRRLERFIFIIAALLVALGAGICTRARVHGRPKRSMETAYLSLPSAVSSFSLEGKLSAPFA